jgi:hypothetical protein
LLSLCLSPAARAHQAPRSSSCRALPSPHLPLDASSGWLCFPRRVVSIHTYTPLWHLLVRRLLLSLICRCCGSAFIFELAWAQAASGFVVGAALMVFWHSLSTRHDLRVWGIDEHTSVKQPLSRVILLLPLICAAEILALWMVGTTSAGNR